MQLTINGGTEDYELDMNFISPNTKTFFFSSNTLQKYWKIPPLFGFSHYYARLNLATAGGYRAHIAPCMTQYRPVKDDAPDSMECPLNEKDAILLGIWRTMCNKPQAWVVVFVPGEPNCQLLNSLEKSNFFFRTRYCDPTIPFDAKAAKEAFDAYRKGTHRNWDPTYHIPRDTKYPTSVITNLRKERKSQQNTNIVVESVDGENCDETEESAKTNKVRLPKTPMTFTPAVSVSTRTSKRLAMQQLNRESDERTKDVGTKQNRGGVSLISNNYRFVTSLIVSCNHDV